MFEDESRPLYKLCWKLTLKRIDDEHYHNHLKKAAIAQWKKPIHEQAFHRIMTLTEKHPFYVNKLCDRIWAFCDKILPSIEEIDHQWKQIIDEEKSDAILECPEALFCLL